jgi:iron complex transport system permease protein
MLAMLLVYGIARLRGMSTETVILAGVAIGFLFSAMLSLIQYVAPEHEALRAVVFWLMGGLSAANWQSIMIVTPIIAITLNLMVTQSWNINILSMGEDAGNCNNHSVHRRHRVCLSDIAAYCKDDYWKRPQVPHTMQCIDRRHFAFVF